LEEENPSFPKGEAKYSRIQLYIYILLIKLLLPVMKGSRGGREREREREKKCFFTGSYII